MHASGSEAVVDVSTRAPALPLRPRIRRQQAPLSLAFASLLLLFPSEVVLVGPLRSNGGPVRIVGMLALTLVVLDLLRRRPRGALRVSAVVVLLTLYAAQALFFYGRSTLDLTSDAATTLRVLMFTLSACGIALYTSVRVTDVRTVHRCLGLLVAGGSLTAVVGVLQALGTGLMWTDVMQLPGFNLSSKPQGFQMREGLLRVWGTAGHPIEFAVILACCLPLAMHLALHAESQRARRASLAAALTMTLGLPFALSRGGLISIVIAVGLFLLAQKWRFRASTVLAGVVALCVAYVLVPSTYRAFESMFANSAEDPSITGRLDDYPIIDAAFNAAPWLGGAPVPKDLLLDNQWLITVTDSGLVGLAFLALLFLLPINALAGCAWRGRQRDAARTSLAMAVLGGIAALAFSGFVFDLMYFGQAAMLLFFLVGLSVAITRDRVIDLSDNRS